MTMTCIVWRKKERSCIHIEKIINTCFQRQRQRQRKRERQRQRKRQKRTRSLFFDKKKGAEFHSQRESFLLYFMNKYFWQIVLFEYLSSIWVLKSTYLQLVCTCTYTQVLGDSTKVHRKALGSNIIYLQSKSQHVSCSFILWGSMRQKRVCMV